MIPRGSVLLLSALPERELARLNELHGKANMTPLVFPELICCLSHVKKDRCVISSFVLEAVSKTKEEAPSEIASLATPPQP